MPIEENITTWAMLLWEQEMSRQDLLAIQIQQLQSRTEGIKKATTRLREIRIKKKDRFDKMKRIQPRKVQEGGAPTRTTCSQLPSHHAEPAEETFDLDLMQQSSLEPLDVGL